MEYKIYLLENNAAFRQVLMYCFEQEGWRVQSFGETDAPLARVRECPDLWILDADGEAGFRVMKAVKEQTADVPIILTSEKERIINRVLGLEFGCYDVVIKPFAPRELVLRVHRLILEHAKQSSLAIDRQMIKLQNYFIDLDQRVVSSDEGNFKLTSKEFELLYLLARNQGLALSREQIIRAIWGEGYYGSDRVVDDLMRRMRRKLKKLRVETLYGFGYRIIA